MEKTCNTSLSDLPFNEDKNDFGTDRYVNGLLKFIENATAPLTIALQGEWGSGKTSLMNRLYKRLCEAPDSQFVGITINTWEYSMMSSPEMTVYKILAQLVKELTDDGTDSKNIFKGFLRGAGNFLYRGAREGIKCLPVVGNVAAVSMEAVGVPEQLPFLTEDTHAASLTDLKTNLKEVISRKIEEQQKRGVIIFVDDLDRLNPPVAVEILELLKNVFTLDHCIFVLAIDYEVVVKGLKPKYGELTEKNEREFRSFFDKIIQVPFSLPVNSYHPMDFILKSLVDIGYVTRLEAADPRNRQWLLDIVGASVGKNPRAIKRLINTLSLLYCIDQSGDQTGSVQTDISDKLLSSIVISIQICYPKIYRILSENSSFMKWNKEVADKAGIVKPKSDNSETKEYWEYLLEQVCASDVFLTQHLQDIYRLFNLIVEICEKDTQHSEKLQKEQLNNKIGEKMKDIIDKSSITNADAAINEENFDRKDLIYKIHARISKGLEVRQDIQIQLKRNTGNGGIWLRSNANPNSWYEIVFRPFYEKNEKKIKLAITLDLRTWGREFMPHKTFEAILQEPIINDCISTLDEVLKPLLNGQWYFEGQIYDGQETYFKSYADELQYKYDIEGLNSNAITDDTTYCIVLENASLFEDHNIIDVIVKLLIANFDFREQMSKFVDTLPQ